MPKTGNKNTDSNTVPTLAEYITAQIASKRATSLRKSRNRTMPAIPIINGVPNKNSCIYTATDNYGNQYRVPGNWTFYENPGKYGFKPVSLDQAVPGDIIQVFDKGAPYHAMTLDSFDEQGRMKYNYSRGSSGDESDIVKDSINFPNTKKIAYTFVGTQADSTQWTNDYKRLYGNQMKCGGRRKSQLGLDIQYGGRAIPIARNMVYFDGNSHAAGGIGVGNNLEVEGGEVGEKKGNTLRIFSAVPFLGGISPAQLVMGGANSNKVFKAQEEFKDRNRINDDGTMYKTGGIYIKPIKRGTFTAAAKKRGMGVQEFANKVLSNKEDYSPAMVKKANFARNASRWKKEYGGDGNVLPEVVVTGKKPKTFFEKLDDYVDISEKALAIPNLALSGASLISPNPITLGGAYLTSASGALLDLYQGGRAVYKGDWFNAGKNVIDLGLSLLGLRALRNANKLNELDKALDASGATREYVRKYVGRGRGKRKVNFTKEKNEAITQEAIGYSSIPAGTAFSMIDTDKNKKEFGGNMIYTVNGNVKNGLMSARPKAKYGKIININRIPYETVDEAVERYKQLYRIRYDKEPSKTDIERIAWTKSLENVINGDPNLIIGYGPNVGVRNHNIAKIVSNANKGKQIARTQTKVRNKNVKSTRPQKQAVNTKVSEAARAERQSQFDAWQQGEAFKASTMPTDAVAINRPTIGTGVRSGRKGRIDDVVAIKRSQRDIDPLASKSEFSVYNKAYAKKVNDKMNQFANVLLGSGTGAVIVGNTLYDEEQSKEEQINSDNNLVIGDSVKSNIKIQSDLSSTKKVNNNKRIVNKNTNNVYISTTKSNTGESYVINPLTGEWIRNGIVETSEPSVKDTTKVNSNSSSTPRVSITKTSIPKTPIPKTVTKTTTKGVDVKYNAPLAENRESLYITGIKNNTSSPIRTGMEKIKSPSSTGGRNQSNSDGRWVPQFNSITTRDWIGLGSNLAGHIASYFTNNALLSKYPTPVKPVMAQAAKFKTTHNINPELTNNREVELTNRGVVRRNTQSSNTSIAREQRIMNEARNARNQLYGRKENIETQLINQDRLNRQSVYQRNVAAYNDWLDKTFVAKNNKLMAKQQNMMNLISGIPMAVNNIIGNIESRQATNNTIKAIAAANPNVDGRLLGIGDYYTQRLGDGRVAVYDKKGKLKKYV